MKKIKEEKGAITLIVLVSMLFLTSFLISAYIIVSNRAKIQMDLTDEIKRTYDNTEDFVIINDSSEKGYIPIYTLDQLRTVLTTSSSTVEINGITYNVTNNSYLAIQNDISINEGNYTIADDGTITFNSSSTKWTPIAPRSTFVGTIDGLGHTISGLDTSQAGAFASASSNIGLVTVNRGTIKNLVITNSYFFAQTTAGAIAATNNGTIENCYVNARVKGYNRTIQAKVANIGGIVGINSAGATVRNCKMMGTVTGEKATANYSNFGGVVGNNSGTIEDCINYGVVGTEAKSNLISMGGIAGNNAGTITKAENYAQVFGGTGVGGIAGKSTATITSCKNEGNIANKTVTSGGDNLGGIVGENTGTISQSFNTGKIEGNTNTSTGGIAGTGGIINSCYNTGAISGKKVGGIFGTITTASSSVTNCYNRSASIAGNASYTGGIAGEIQQGIIANCYTTETIASDTAIVGTINEPYTSKIENCYAKDGTALYLFRTYDTSNSTSTTVDDYSANDVEFLIQSNMSGSSFIATLNGSSNPAEWKDPSTINDTYPVLSWQSTKTAIPL